MKTIGYLIDPDHDTYRSIGDLAFLLRLLLSTAKPYRDKGQWGESGPHETLVNYGSCTNCLQEHWHSSRIHVGPHGPETTTWQENHDALRDCILSSLCSSGGAHARWRNRHGISLQMLVKFPKLYQHADSEKIAWKKFEQLHGYELAAPTLNRCHKKIRILTEPQLEVSADGVFITCQVTDRRELRTSPRCYSRWSVTFLCRDTEWGQDPRWDWKRETFADFVLRSVRFYRGAGGKNGVKYTG